MKQISDITAIAYAEELRDAWDYFVCHESRNGTIFHERNFLEYHPVDRFIDSSLVFLRNKRIVGVLPAAQVKAGEARIVSHPGSSAGGLVFQRTHTLRDVLGLLESALCYYRDKGFQSLELRLGEPIFSSPTDNELTYLLWHRGLRLITREISSCIDLSDGKSWLRYGRKKNGNDIRRLEKMGIRTVQLDDPSEIYPLIERNLNNRYKKKPTHTFSELLELKRRYPARVHFWAASFDQKCIATAVTFVANQNAIHTFYIAVDYDYARLQVMPLLFHGILAHYQQQGYRWFNFGISSRESLIKWGILEFKERLGGRATMRETWTCEDLSRYERYSFEG